MSKERLAAAVRGFLVRKLWNTDRVQSLIKSVRDLNSFLHSIEKERTGAVAPSDRQFAQQLRAQVSRAKDEFYSIFFDLPAAERLRMIAAARYDSQLYLL